MSLSATLFGRDSIIFKAANIMGLGVPGLLDKWFGADPPPAQRLGEISQQTAKEAEPRVIVWGRVRPIGGNLIHCQKPVKRMVKVKSESGGKGGSKKKKTQKVEHVFRTYAIGVCEGPITRFSRIWRNNKLVYDGRGTTWGAENNHVFLKKFRLYLGGWDQMPSPDLEAIWGVGNVPAYRGTAYMVSIDEDLTEPGGMVPQWLFEVDRAEGVYYTSKPYQVGYTEAVGSSPGVSDLGLRDIVIEYKAGDEFMSAIPGFTGLSFTDRSPTIPDYIEVEPGISEIYMSPPPEPFAENIAVAPGFVGTKYSITHPADPPEYIGVQPGITEVTLT